MNNYFKELDPEGSYSFSDVVQLSRAYAEFRTEKLAELVRIYQQHVDLLEERYEKLLNKHEKLLNL